MKLAFYKRGTLGVSVKNRNEFSDYDYLHKLSRKDLKWLKTFHQEWLQANFKHKHKILTGKQLRKDVYDRNNARNRDAYAICKVYGLLMFDFEENSDKWYKMWNNI